MPDATAIRFHDDTLTYGELEEQSNRLAHALIGMGVTPGDRIGLAVEKSTASIVSVFAVLKARGCYVPIEANTPPPRAASIMRQCGIRCLIGSQATAQKLLGAFREDSALERLVLVDNTPGIDLPSSLQWVTFSQVLPAQDATLPALGGTDQDLAYVLFTSGSTGTPKGVMLSHLNALTFVNWGCQTFQIRPEDRLSNHAPLSFDLSVFDIFAGVKAGATISLVPETLSFFPIRLAEFIERHRITVWYSVPSALVLLVMYGKLEGRDLQDLRIVLFAGEVFPVKHLRRLMTLVPQAKYFNLYGPTETNVCTYYGIEPIPDDQITPIPIGKACANTEVLAIDEHGQLVTAAGQEGLLHVRGSTVMQGYFGRPADTERVLIRNPFSPGRDERIYCTGDRVTLGADANYHFRGRNDHLIKTRGYRVELGEVESALYAHPAVREAAAVAVPDERLGNRIKVFVVIDDRWQVDGHELRRHCAQVLPRYMVPEEVELRTLLPRTATGKVDRTRLAGETVGFS